MKTEQDKPRIYGLDIMRAVAITYVMLSHGYTYSGHMIHFSYYKWLILDGVGLFFVLSGFLIGGILIRKIETGPFGIRQLTDFWLRRWLRTIPAYFFVLTFLIACYYFSRHALPPYWLRYYTFTQNFAWPHPLFFGEAWSLSVEEWFYILVPSCLFLLVRLPGKKSRQILSCILLVLLLVTSFRLYKVEQQDYFADGTLGINILKIVITRLDAIMYGVLAAWLSIYCTSTFYKYKNTLLVTGLLLLIACNMLFSPFFLTRIHYSLIPIAAACLLPALSSLKEGKGRLYRLVTFISIISYSMYLTNHMIVQRGMLPFIIKSLHLDLEGNRLHNLLVFPLFWLLTIASAYALNRLVEQPFMNLRKKLKG